MHKFYLLLPWKGAFCLGIVDWSGVEAASWVQVPTFYEPTFNIHAIMIIMPALFVVFAEHIGHVVVTSSIVDRDLIKNPGLNRSLFADGVSNVLSGFVGSTPNTTYGENTGVLNLTKVFDPAVIRMAACFAILLSFSPKFACLIG